MTSRIIVISRRYCSVGRRALSAAIPPAVPPNGNPPSPPLAIVATTGAFTTLGLGAICALHHFVGSDATLVLGSFGATACLIFAAPSAPFSQPRNVIGGHLLAAGVGSSARYGAVHLAPEGFPVLCSLPFAAATAIMLMQLTRTMHPPAGGTSLIAATHATLGFELLLPTALGSSMLVASGCALNNLVRSRTPYPTRWD